MRGLLLVAALIGAVYVFNYLRAAPKQPAPPPPAAIERQEPRKDHWSGIWGAKSSALLRLRQIEDGSIVGEYLPPRGRAVLCRFTGGMVEGDTARFDVKIDGTLWHLELVRSGDSATLRGRKDMNALLDAYGRDGRPASGALIISPRSWEQTITERERLQRKREEIRRAGEIVPLGTFERIEAPR